MKTIRELAEELNVSKTTIRNYLRKLPENLSPTKKGNTLHLDSDIERFIRNELQSVTDKFSETNAKQVFELQEKITILEERNQELKAENLYLREQTSEKNEQIRNINKILDQAQQLHASDKQLLNQYKEEKEQQMLLEQKEKENKGFWYNLFHNS